MFYFEKVKGGKWENQRCECTQMHTNVRQPHPKSRATAEAELGCSSRIEKQLRDPRLNLNLGSKKISQNKMNRGSREKRHRKEKREEMEKRDNKKSVKMK